MQRARRRARSRARSWAVPGIQRPVDSEMHRACRMASYPGIGVIPYLQTRSTPWENVM